MSCDGPGDGGRGAELTAFVSVPEQTMGWGEERHRRPEGPYLSGGHICQVRGAKVTLPK